MLSQRFVAGFKRQGREGQPGNYKTVDVITEYSDFTWECNQLTSEFHGECEQQSISHFIFRAF